MLTHVTYLDFQCCCKFNGFDGVNAISNRKVTDSPDFRARGPDVVEKVPLTTEAPVVVVVLLSAPTPPQLVGMNGLCASCNAAVEQIASVRQHSTENTFGVPSMRAHSHTHPPSPVPPPSP